MTPFTSNAALVLCAAILFGSISFAFGRRYCGCEHLTPVAMAADRVTSDAPIASIHQPASDSPSPSSAVLVRDPVADAPTAEPVSLVRIAELEAEVAPLRSDLRDVEFARMLTSIAPQHDPVGLADALRTLDESDLTCSPEMRAMFVQEVRHDTALELLRTEPKFRSALAKTYSVMTTEQRAFEWPVRRDQLVQDFFRKLGEAGLSGRTIEHYRATIADYLDG